MLTIDAALDRGKRVIVIPNWQYIIVHYSTTPDGQTFDTQGIWDYHMSYRIDYEIVANEEYVQRYRQHLLNSQDSRHGKVFERPWSDVGYHTLVETVGKHCHVVLGRPLTKRGAHCSEQDKNGKAIGICFIGNYDVDEPPTIVLETPAKRFIVPVMVINNISLLNIKGHRDYAQKTCLGERFNLEALRDIVISIAKI